MLALCSRCPKRASSFQLRARRAGAIPSRPADRIARVTKLLMRSLTSRYAPAVPEPMVEPELIEDPCDDGVDGIAKRARVPVESRHGREDRRTRTCEHGQVLQVDDAEGRLAGDNDQPPPLLQH